MEVIDHSVSVCFVLSDRKFSLSSIWMSADRQQLPDTGQTQAQNFLLTSLGQFVMRLLVAPVPVMCGGHRHDLDVVDETWFSCLASVWPSSCLELQFKSSLRSIPLERHSLIRTLNTNAPSLSFLLPSPTHTSPTSFYLVYLHSHVCMLLANLDRLCWSQKKLFVKKVSMFNPELIQTVPDVLNMFHSSAPWTLTHK